MKLATYKDGSRDGQLVVVSRDLSTAHYATGIANQLQQVLDDWNFYAPQLQDLSDLLNRTREGNTSKPRHAFGFDPKQCMAPLPRAYQWVDSMAFVNHQEVCHQAQNEATPTRLDTEPLMMQGASDDFLGACDEIAIASEALGLDFQAGLAVITGDVRLGTPPAQALASVRLLMLANSLCLRQPMTLEQTRGLGFIQSKPATSFSPVAVTLDELVFNGESVWDQGRVHLNLQSTWNGRKVGMCEAGPEMTFHFGQLMAHLCKTRNLRAGTLIGSGPVSNQNKSHGYSSIMEKRARETLQNGQPATEFLKYGDTLRIEMKGRDGQSLFGAIAQEIVSLDSARDACVYEG